MSAPYNISVVSKRSFTIVSIMVLVEDIKTRFRYSNSLKPWSLVMTEKFPIKSETVMTFPFRSVIAMVILFLYAISSTNEATAPGFDLLKFWVMRLDAIVTFRLTENS